MTHRKHLPRIPQTPLYEIGVTLAYLVLLCGFFWGCLFSIHALDQKLHSHAHSEYLNTESISYFPLPPGRIEKASSIWYKRTSQDHIDKYTGQLLQIVNKEFKSTEGISYISCDSNKISYDGGKFIDNLYKQNQLCSVYDPKNLDWGNCTPTGQELRTNGPFKLHPDAFGYRRGLPCVLLRPNHLIGWAPSTKPAISDKEFDSNEIGRKYKSTLLNATKNSPSYNQLSSLIWILCDGENEEDRQLMGTLEYYPRGNRIGGIPKFYFPFRNQNGFLMPFVFVRFVNPVPHVVIRIKCEFFRGKEDHEGHDHEEHEHSHSDEHILKFEIIVD